MPTTDYYEVLGVSRDASTDDIKKAYRRLARQLHPDINPDPQTQERFKEVTNAYEVLADARKREMYDLGADPLASGNGAGGGFGAGFSFTDIMDAFFGGTTTTRGPRSRVRRGQDALVRLEVELAEAAFGATKDLHVDTAIVCGTCQGAGTSPGTHMVTCHSCSGRGEISQVQRSFLGQVMTTRPCPQCHGFGTVNPRPCVECAGDGRVRTRRNLTIKIPAGVDSGTRIQLAGEGEVGPGGGPPGDLYVELVMRPHPVFDRNGDDLHCTVELAMTAAALGTTIELETLDGAESIEVKAGAQHGQILKIPARGVPKLRGTGRGDLLVHLEVRTPTRLDSRQEELLRELAQLRNEEHPTGRSRRRARTCSPASETLSSDARPIWPSREQVDGLLDAEVLGVAHRPRSFRATSRVGLSHDDRVEAGLQGDLEREGRERAGIGGHREAVVDDVALVVEYLPVDLSLERQGHTADRHRSAEDRSVLWIVDLHVLPDVDQRSPSNRIGQVELTPHLARRLAVDQDLYREPAVLARHTRGGSHGVDELLNRDLGDVVPDEGVVGMTGQVDLDDIVLHLDTTQLRVGLPIALIIRILSSFGEHCVHGGGDHVIRDRRVLELAGEPESLSRLGHVVDGHVRVSGCGSSVSGGGATVSVEVGPGGSVTDGLGLCTTVGRGDDQNPWWWCRRTSRRGHTRSP